MLIDFSKAFNLISCTLILSTFKVFNFPEEYIAWIKTLLLDFSSMTLVNGYLSMKILLERGCHQGDPIASYLFILAIEVLMLRIFNYKDIHPWKSLKNNSHLQDGYADNYEGIESSWPSLVNGSELLT